MPYNVVRDKGPNGTPSLALMTKQALGILSRPNQGFVLMVLHSKPRNIRNIILTVIYI